MNIVKPEKISLKNNPDLDEKKLQEEIAKDPSIIGLGDLVLKDKERIQPRAGRLDLLLQDPESYRRYEVEVQLGATDESHIIRTIEYWDIERKRYPQYDHCAVIIAEDITSRFLNVISLFNGFIPLVAIKVNAIKIGNDVGFVFTKVLDEIALGLVDEDEDVQEVTDRSYWMNKLGSEKTLKMADELLTIVNEVSSGYSLKYNKPYIGLEKDGRANNFVYFRPRKQHVTIEIKHPKSEEINDIISDHDLVELEYNTGHQVYKISLQKNDIKEKKEALTSLIELAHNYRNG